MKDLIKQKITKFRKRNKKHIYPISIDKQLLLIIKEIYIYILILFILVFYYYICMCIYNFDISNDNSQLNTVYTTSFVELKSVNKNEPNIWYKHFLEDFFNKFTSNSKTINHKFIEVKSDIKTFMRLELEHNLTTERKSVILNKIQSDSMKGLRLECEFYKNKTYFLEIQLLNTKIAYQNLIKDIDDIIKEMPYSLKKPWC